MITIDLSTNSIPSARELYKYIESVSIYVGRTRYGRLCRIKRI